MSLRNLLVEMSFIGFLDEKEFIVNREAFKTTSSNFSE